GRAVGPEPRRLGDDRLPGDGDTEPQPRGGYGHGGIRPRGDDGLNVHATICTRDVHSERGDHRPHADPQGSGTYRVPCSPGTGAASRNCQAATGATMSTMNRVRTFSPAPKTRPSGPPRPPPRSSGSPKSSCLPGPLPGADDGIRTRDPHLGK